MSRNSSEQMLQDPQPASPRHEEILHSLIDLFLSAGFRSQSVEDMANWARCSKRTIYFLGESKEQIILSVIRGFFRNSTLWISERISEQADPVQQIGEYLKLISEALAPASQQFFDDLNSFAPAREIYRQNTRVAAERVQGLVREAISERSRVDAEFIGAVAGIVMNAIQRNEIKASTSLEDAEAYRALANLIVAGVKGSDP